MCCIGLCSDLSTPFVERTINDEFQTKSQSLSGRDLSMIVARLSTMLSEAKIVS
jgi:hypothetical protein